MPTDIGRSHKAARAAVSPRPGAPTRTSAVLPASLWQRFVRVRGQHRCGSGVDEPPAGAGRIPDPVQMRDGRRFLLPGFVVGPSRGDAGALMSGVSAGAMFLDSEDVAQDQAASREERGSARLPVLMDRYGGLHAQRALALASPVRQRPGRSPAGGDQPGGGPGVTRAGASRGATHSTSPCDHERRICAPSFLKPTDVVGIQSRRYGPSGLANPALSDR
jgi:hypothetical protein